MGRGLLNKMQLQHAIARLDEFDDEQIICAAKPWTPTSETVLTLPDQRAAVPDEIKQAGFEYFLEVAVAKEVIEVLQGNDTAARRERLLIEYAETDAFPDWVYLK
jgi:hypothetical protein